MRIMKAISIKQPWASLIAEGYKSIETRIWKTDYRGELLILSSLNIDKYAMKHFSFADKRGENSILEFPVGMALCVADLVDCRKMTKDDEPEAMCEIYPRANSFVLENIREIKPFKVKGQLNIFDLQVDNIEYI